MASKLSDIVIKLMLDNTDVVKGLTDAQKEFGGFSSKAVQEAATSGSAFRNFGAELHEVGLKMQDVGKNMTLKVTAPIVAGLGLAVNEAMKFESSFAGVKKTVDATDAEFEVLKTNLKEMSLYLPANVNEINAVAEAAGQLGIALQDIDKFTEVMINLGVATNMTAEGAAVQFARLQNIMGFTADDYERLGSVVVELGNNYATTESEIMAFTMRLAPMAKQMNMNTQETMAVSAAFTSMGLTAEAGGTAIGKLLSSMQLASSKGVADMASLEKATGMTARELKLLSENGGKDFKALADSMGMTASEMNLVVKSAHDLDKMAEIAGVSGAEFAEVFGTDATKALDMFFGGLNEVNMEGESAAAILAEMGINEVRLRNAVLSGAAANDLFAQAIKDGNRAFEENIALQEEADKRYETLESQLTLAGNAIRFVAINLGEQMIPMIKDFTTWVQNVATAISEMDPETFRAIAETLVKIATIGPALLVVGKLFTTVQKGADITMKAVSGIRKGFEYAFNPTYLDNAGKWTDKMLKQMNGSINTNGDAVDAFGKQLKTSTDGLSKMAKEGEITIPKFNSVGTALSKVTTSTVATGLGFLGLGLYLKDAYDNSEMFKDGLNLMLDGLKSVGSFIGDVLGNVFGALGEEVAILTSNVGDIIAPLDLLVIGIGALGLKMQFLNPFLGYALIAFAGFKILTSVIGWISNLSIETFDAANSMAIFNDKVDSVESTVDRFNKQSGPQLQRTFSDLTTTLNNFDVTGPVEELTKLGEKTNAAAEESLSNMTLLHTAQLDELHNYYASKGEVDSEEHQADIERLGVLWDTKKGEVEGSQNAINLILAQAAEEERNLTDEELKIYQRHYQNLRDEATSHYQYEADIQQLRVDKKLASIKEGVALEGEELDKTLAMIEESYDKQSETDIRFYKDKEDRLKMEYEAGILSEDQYLAQLAQARADAYVADQNLLIESYKEKFKATTGYNLDDLKAADEAYSAKSRLWEENRKLVNTTTANMTADQKKVHQGEIDRVQAEQKANKSRIENLKLTESEWRKYNKEIDNQASDTSEAVRGYMQGTDFSAIGVKNGQDYVDGIDSGAAGKEGKLKQTLQGMAARASGIWNSVFEIKSPSRFMKRVGGHIIDGLIVGMEDEESDLTKATEEMAGIITDQDYSVDSETSISRKVIDDVSSTGEIRLASAVAKAVAKEMEKAHIRAFISEEDYEEGVEEVFRRQML